MAHVHTHRWLLDRRHVLSGMGVSLALPFLDCMRPPRGQVAEKPRRAVFCYVANGVNMLDWQVRTAGAGYEMSPSLAPLERHRESLTVFSGLHHPHAVGSTHRCDRVWLTGAQLVDGNAERRNTISVDQRMAAVAAKHTRFPSIELAVASGRLAWSADGVALPAERSPRAAFERLFEDDPGGKEAARRRLRRKESVLDAVLAHARRLRRDAGGIGKEDRTRLDEYLTAVREVELRTHRAESWLDVPRPEVDGAAREGLTREIREGDTRTLYRTFLDLIALALRTDVTRVVTFMTGNENHTPAIPGIGVDQTRHELSHHGGNPAQMGKLSLTDAFLCGEIARFLDALAESDEEGERLLDRTMVLVGSGMSYGHNHGNANLPTLLAGGRSLGLLHGRHLDYNLPRIGAYDLEDTSAYYGLCLRPADESARLSNLLLTMLRCQGVEADSFADSERPLSEFLA